MKAFVINLKESPDRLAQFRENQFPFDVDVFDALTPLTLGIEPTNEHRDWACSLSHIAVIKQQTEFPFAVFEDDCVLLQPWSLVERAIEQLPSDWDALWLGATLQAPIERYSENLYRLVKGHALHAVIYNTQRIVDFSVANYNTKDFRCFDVLLAYTGQRMFNCYCVYPIAATQRACMSDINNCFLDNYNIIIDAYNKYTK